MMYLIDYIAHGASFLVEDSFFQGNEPTPGVTIFSRSGPIWENSEFDVGISNHTQYILLDTMFNNIFDFGPPGTYL